MGTNKKNGKPDPLDAASFVIGNWYHWGAIDFPFTEVTKKTTPGQFQSQGTEQPAHLFCL